LCKVVAYLSMKGHRKLSDFIKKIFICVTKMNESLKGLERHDRVINDILFYFIVN